MNLKPVELQIAIPRTQAASAIQHQLQQRAATDQFLLNEQVAKHLRTQRQRSESVTASAELGVRERSKDEEHKEKDEEQSDVQEESILRTTSESTPAKHPFKGKHFDYKI